MQRREFVAGTTLGVLAGMTVGGCGGARVPLSQADASSLLDRLERGRQRVRTGPSLYGDATDPHLDRMTRLGLEALVVADVARSIPRDAELPGPLAGALADALPVLDECVAQFGALLGGMPMGARRSVERATRERPDAAVQVAEWIDAQATGIDRASRGKLRQLAHQVATKTRRQSMGAVIDDTVGKVERIVAQKGGPVAFAREATASAMLASVWQALEGDGVPPSAGGRGLDAPSGEPRGATPPPPPESEAPLTVEEVGGPGDPEIAVGAVMMGSGVVVFGILTLAVGIATESAAIGALVGATPGGTLVIVGLIVLIVGLAQNA